MILKPVLEPVFYLVNASKCKNTCLFHQMPNCSVGKLRGGGGVKCS